MWANEKRECLRRWTDGTLGIVLGSASNNVGATVQPRLCPSTIFVIFFGGNFFVGLDRLQVLAPHGPKRWEAPAAILKRALPPAGGGWSLSVEGSGRPTRGTPRLPLLALRERMW